MVLVYVKMCQEKYKSVCVWRGGAVVTVRIIGCRQGKIDVHQLEELLAER